MNASTSDFGKFATNNNDEITEYNKILNFNNNLINNLQSDVLNFDIDTSETTMEPPYATE